MSKFNDISRRLRKWGATGAIFRSVDTKLSSGRRDQIKDTLELHGIPLENLEKFIEALEDGITNFKSYELMHDSSRPAVVRENLNGALKMAEHLHESLQGLDGNSHQLIREAHEGGSRSLQAAAAKTISALKKAIRLANEYPRSGRLREPHRVYLAADVADAMRTHLGVKPTSTKNSIFIGVLEIVLEVATEKEPKAVHELARTALSYDAKLKHADGTVEYIPPNQD